MQKRARAVETQKLRRAMKGRRGADLRESSSMSMAYARLTIAWLIIVLADVVVGFRFELLWPFWMLVRGFYESFQRQNVFMHLGGHTSTVLFVCVTATSDLICYLFIPVRVLVFVATTYVWMTLVWHVNGGFLRTLATIFGDRTQAVPIVLLWGFVVAFEIFCRFRCDYLIFLRSNPFGGYFSEADVSECLHMQGMSPPIQRSVNAFLGAHCIGYPLIVISFNISYYWKEWRIRRKQEDVSRKNEVLVRLLTEAIPAVYEGPKVYGRGDFALDDEILDEDLLGLESSVPGQLLPPPPPPPGIMNNGSAARKTSLRNGSSNAKHKANGKAKAPLVGGASNGSTNHRLLLRERERDPSSASKQNQQDEDGHYDSWRVGDSEDLEASGSAPSAFRFLVDIVSRLLEWMLRGDVSSSSHRGHHSSSLNDACDDDYDDDEESVPEEKKDRSRNGTSVSSVTIGSSSKCQNNNSSSRPRGGSGAARSRGAASATQTVLLPHANGTARSCSAATDKESNGGLGTRRLRDTSRDSNQTETEGATNHRPVKECGEECKRVEAECARLRNEIRMARSSEESARLQAQSSANAEKLAASQVSTLQQRLATIEARLATAERQRDAEKSAVSAAEKRLADITSKKSEVERELVAERKARRELINGTKKSSANKSAVESASAELASLREKEKSVEKELDRLRMESASKDDAILEMSAQLVRLKEQVAAAVDVEEMKRELRLLQEKNSQLEESLAAENKYKQELFRALGDAKASNEHLRREAQSMRQSQTGAMGGRFSGGYPVEKASPPPPPAYSTAMEDAFALGNAGGAPTRPCYSFTSQHVSSPTGEHTLFEPVFAPSSPSLSCALSPSDPLIVSRMGKFGAPSPASHTGARSN